MHSLVLNPELLQRYDVESENKNRKEAKNNKE